VFQGVKLKNIYPLSPTFFSTVNNFSLLQIYIDFFDYQNIQQNKVFTTKNDIKISCGKMWGSF
jgi:hypothetical protein